MTANQRFVLTLSCPDTVDIVAAVTNALATHRALITDAQHHREPVSNSTVLRVVFEAGGPEPLDMERLSRDFLAVANQFRMTWRDSRYCHAAASVGGSIEAGALPQQLVALLGGRNVAHRHRGIVSNHETQRCLAEWHKIPFHYLPIKPGRKEQQEEQLLALFAIFSCSHAICRF